jgi:hypothetical protein
MINLRQALNALPYYFLEDLVQELLGKISVPNRSAQVRVLAETLERRETLRSLWERLRPEEQEAVRLALYNGGKLDLITFEGLYGELPEKAFSGVYGYRRKPQYLKLFFLSGWDLPVEMMETLKEWVQPPPIFQPQTLSELPSRLKMGEGEVDLLAVETEKAAWHDLAAVLRIAKTGALKVSETTFMPSASAVRAMQKELALLDYYEVGDLGRAAETIRPVGLVVALQAGGLAKAEGSQLSLTEFGEEWLEEPTPQGLRTAFEGWLESQQLDELRRIGSLRGLQSSGAEFTDPSARRKAILDALRHFHPAEWVSIEEFFKTIKLCGHNFEVEPGEYTAIQVNGYGLLDNATHHTYWRAVNGQYVLAVVMEYLASFGVVDFACVDPRQAGYELGRLGDYVTRPFSRYDGLKFIRLTRLGAYLLGQQADYELTDPADVEPLIEFAGGLLLNLRRPQALNPNDRVMLERFAERVGETVYRLDGRRFIEACEEGFKTAEAWNFLLRKSRRELPDEVNAFFERLHKRAQVLVRKQDAVLYQVKDKELMKSLLLDQILGDLCVLAEDHQLVVPIYKEEAFRRRLHELEAGVKN